MTAEPQIGYPGQQEGWQQTPAGYLGAEGPSGLSQAFAGYRPDTPSGLNQAPPVSSFAGHDPSAPSGLSFIPPAVQSYGDPPVVQSYGGPPTAGYQEPAYAPPPQAAYPDPAFAAPQAAYPDPAFAAPQAAYPDPAFAAPQAAYPPPQAAYPEPAPAPAAGYGRPAYGGPGVPGYLQPYGQPNGFAGKGPSVGPVVAFTVFFGVFGAISAARRADRARAVGDRTGKYWIAYGATLAGSWVVGAIVGILLFAMGVSVGTTSKSSTAIALQQSIVQQGTFPDATGKTLKVKTASCTAQQLAPNSSWGTYTCALGLVGGTTDTVIVSLDSGGRWRVVGQAK